MNATPILSNPLLNGLWELRLHGTPRGEDVPTAQLRTAIPATMPGSVHVALQEAGIVTDPFYGRNELDQQWIDIQDWELSRTVTATAADCARTRQELIFNGIDTIATIRLNGSVVGRSVNMFRRVVCDVRGVLKPGKNVLSVVLESPTRYAQAFAAGAKGQIRPDDFIWQTGEKRPSYRTGIRKVQCHFGWDWGTYLATSGLWQDASLECLDTPRIAAVQVSQTHLGPVGAPTRVTLDITVHLAHPAAVTGSVVAILMGGPMPKEDRRERAVISQSGALKTRAGESTATLVLEVANPLLWWPAHEGEQYLYYLSVHVVTALGERSAESLTKIGLRTCEVITTKDTAADGSPGTSFYFQVNGRPIYAKGANWIPADQFVERCTPSVYRHLLESMVEANMNMVRVWGGGWYEQEVFYDLCDELGILVWQDFMMACGFYPDLAAFTKELAAEARYQIRRLSARPSLALWCGDNENNTGVAHWWKTAGSLASRMRRYTKVIGALGKVVAEEDPDRRFWPSSPSNGVISDSPDSPNHGDVHYWTVWHGKQPFSNYLTVKPRFASEFGFQSFPEPRTLRDCIPAADMNPSSRVMEHHQRSNDGNLMITNTMAREMLIPKDFPSFCWVSQINQAMAIRTAVEHWRRLKPWCMGTLYWQINDLWPVASWSSIDYHGRWKVLQHAAARFYAPLLASLILVDGQLEAWVTSDVPSALPLTGTVTTMTWDGKAVGRFPFSLKLPAQGSKRVLRLPVTQLTTKHEAHQLCCFISVKAPGHSAENFQTLVPWKWIGVVKPRLSTKLVAIDGGVALEVTPTTVVPFFHAELGELEGHFVGDWQVLRPNTTYRLPWVAHTERGASMPTLAQARAQLTTLSLWDTVAH